VPSVLEPVTTTSTGPRILSAKLQHSKAGTFAVTSRMAGVFESYAKAALFPNRWRTHEYEMEVLHPDACLGASVEHPGICTSSP